jgi:ribonuclease HII
VTKKYTQVSKNFFEDDAWSHGHLVCGIDEVGRGCLAGPVVVAAAVLHPYAHHDLLRDSKVLTAGQREAAYDWIVEHCKYYAVATVGSHVVDAINIYQATLKGMQRAYIHLADQQMNSNDTLKYAVVDAMPLIIPKAYASDGLEVCYFTKGESLSTSIAAASIIAKVTRDRLMNRFDKLFPSYAFAQHKGYATKEHMDAIVHVGVSIAHRRTFLKMLDEKECTGQQSIF